MTRYRIVPERSQLLIDAKSSVHPIHGETSGVGGTIEAEVVDGRLDLATAPSLRLEVPVELLKSGNALYDKEMQRRIDARRFPTIVAEARQVSAIDGSADRYRVQGDLTFHGVTRPAEGELQIVAQDERTLVVEGEHQFDIRDFDVTPPKILMVRVHPDVTARIKLVAEREG